MPLNLNWLDLVDDFVDWKNWIKVFYIVSWVRVINKISCLRQTDLVAALNNKIRSTDFFMLKPILDLLALDWNTVYILSWFLANKISIIEVQLIIRMPFRLNIVIRRPLGIERDRFTILFLRMIINKGLFFLVTIIIKYFFY
jgi:hypothetical protein